MKTGLTVRRCYFTYPVRIYFRIRDVLAETPSLLSINDPVDDSMGDMNTLGSEFTRERLGQSTDSKLAHGESGKPRASLERGRCPYSRQLRDGFLDWVRLSRTGKNEGRRMLSLAFIQHQWQRSLAKVECSLHRWLKAAQEVLRALFQERLFRELARNIIDRRRYVEIRSEFGFDLLYCRIHARGARHVGRYAYCRASVLRDVLYQRVEG